jgi:2',3'-cyclic-nucleotide 2'-phosphodiesterase (5'-nucleotidase family)
MGIETLENLIKKSNFPWLLSNVFDHDKKPLLLNVSNFSITEIDNLKVK